MVLFSRLDELDGGDVAPEVNHIEARAFQHDLDKILADVVGVALDDADHDGMAYRVLPFFDMRLQYLDARIHRVGTEQKLWDEIFLFLVKPPDFLHTGGQSFIDSLVCVKSLVYHRLRQFPRQILVHIHDCIRKSLMQLLFSCHCSSLLGILSPK